MDFINTFGSIWDQIGKLLLPHWPGLLVFAVLTVVGQHLSLRVFTRERAYKNYGKGVSARWKWRFFYWGRETLALQPILAGMLIGLVWVDPEQHGWTRPTSVGYFTTAGVSSLFGWALLKGFLKKKGIELTLPGHTGSTPPAHLPYDETELPVVVDSAALAPPPVPTDLETTPTLPPITKPIRRPE